MNFDVSIIIPTFDERENIKKLIPKIADAFYEYDHEIIVVDDSSPDGTALAAKELACKYPVRVIIRPKKLGLASAVVEGFRNARGECIGVIDADLQHPPEYIKEFVYAVFNGYDIAVGSRYAENGGIEGWSRFRSLVSKGAVALAMPLTSVKDPVSGYFFLRRKVIEGISFNPIGYKILLEILVKGSYQNIKEIPFTFKLRERGKSKLGINEYASYLKLLYHLYGFRLKRMVYGR